ncbi:ABC transporter substrate-binding protein [Ramlibacter sp. AW1]|uniref:ABC transporter substrate-binding protein n=1 Tax=Ramlibacter aurantiacus TaxID=2801330 RepID=A0A936ZS54_9BURK|nr:ABC transporter substrate-binding protein [Ramlibacter aurantiacus]MBL0422635.1 ABC transporter substrate-binding protein [Ramlibacter aurantiacus]
MSKLKLSLACWNYDRTRALMDGSVSPDGIDLTYLNLPVEETFFRMLRNREFDVAELSLSSYLIAASKPNNPFIAIPVFPSCMFRHSGIFVNANSGISKPEDLIGKRVGTPEYQMTAAVWIRGILAEHHGVPVDSVTYFTGGAEQPGRTEKLKLDLPSNIRVERIGATQTLSKMLQDGEIDALYSARTPSTFKAGDGKVRRLFSNYAEVERAYYRKTRIFPIMHVMVIRRDVYEQNRWIAASLYKAFVEAQRIIYDEFDETVVLKTMLPWMTSNVDEVRAEMGPDFWPYGLNDTRTTLDTLLKYSVQQGLTPSIVEAESLFAPETLETYKI